MAVPAFGTEVLVRKRYWKSKELEPTHEKVRYVAPIPEVHGHLLVEADGALRVTAYTMASTREPPEKEETWIAIKTEVEDREDELEVRRRIRGKTAVKKLKGEIEVDTDEDPWRRSTLREVIEKESVTIIEDEGDVAKRMHVALRMMMKELEVMAEEEEVLRTRIVSVAEFLKDSNSWDEAIMSEMRQLFHEKEALEKTTLRRLQEEKERGAMVELIPSKLVITLKPGPRRKVRIVACGNYVEFKGEELFASGADASALRMVLKAAAEGGWSMLTVDIRVAFLNAPLTTTRKDGTMTEEEITFALKPPSLLVRLGYAEPHEAWITKKAMYGLRQSPRSWSLYRDQTMASLELHGLRLRQAASEPNLWLVENVNDEIEAMILVYVDDMMIAGKGETTERLLSKIQEIWQTSEPERISEGVTSKFLGMEISKVEDEVRATQTSFIKERLSTNFGEDWENERGATAPCGRDLMEVEEEKDVTQEEVREAQRIVGELLWLVTRTRVDLMFVTAKLAHMVLRAPTEVARLSKQVWKYLKVTKNEGLVFRAQRGEGWAGEGQSGLQAFTDASFAPGGSVSIGAVVVLWNGAPMMWRKQSFLTMSAAEAELAEATEGMLMGDAFDALLSDIYTNYPKSLMIDNQAAISLISEPSGAWRTRHLRLRANHLRWRISRMDWRVTHCPGAQMAADIGTKPLLAGRLEELKPLCGMFLHKEKDGGSGKPKEIQLYQVKKALRLVVLATLMTATTAQPEGEEDPPREEFRSDRGFNDLPRRRDYPTMKELGV